ncbi:sigma-54 interaction domain-containing protein [Alicyclobacillus fastidiosus]|uniref:HTH-type transcriptional regulatory protein TyrR n=1 Tax=Alicyclobacillus fastidiosus TaxID=392011 RepID=A0ABV5ADU7_9BACL|nr:sigma 54-interacting transcriptional regulator [Alicyclobacillus fastidiosus]WEH11276.1 sigma 54-interacting transcriptional regulator [Alicyclobacillus fastidiosus]
MEMSNLFKVLNTLDTPLLIVQLEGKLEWANQAAKMSVLANFRTDANDGTNTNDPTRINVDSFPDITPSDSTDDAVSLISEARGAELVLPEGFSYILHKEIFGPNRFLIECLRLPEGPDESHIWALQQEKSDLAELIDSSLDEWYITDGEGITLQVNDQVEQMYGPLVGGLVGKSIFDLERQRIFYPSVTAMVLRHRKQQTVLQNTIDGRRLISTGNAIFNADGSIKRVISYAKDVSELELLTLNGRPALPPESTVAPSEQPTPFVSNSPAMRRCMDRALRVARTNASVILLGETGVGKNRVAKYIHQISQWSKGPWVEINCASIPESLLESELFGYERGSFTGARREGKPGKVELAQGGTLFLNEIGELPLNLQGKLLDLLQEHRIERIGATAPTYVDTRIITATNRNLREMVTQGTFRADLFYRLNVIPIEIPPLRQRIEDITPLCEVYLAQFTNKHNLKEHVLDEAALDLLRKYEWPGNIRELENILEYLAITVDDVIIQTHHLPPEVVTASASPRCEHATLSDDWKHHLRTSEREIYAAALAKCSSTREVAALLGVSQSTVVRKLKQHGLR